MIRFPNCKINIGLYVTGKRADGYHDLETVFYPLQLSDALEIVPAEVSALHIEGHAIAGSEKDNLVWKAYKMLKSKYPSQVGNLDIWLLKAIPMGAGVGGGSADGASMLLLMNEYYKLGLDKSSLLKMALELGSDCPFFIENTPQFATGRGEQMTPVQLDLSKYSIQLVCPHVHISTAAAFKMIVPKPAPFDLKRLSELPIELWAEYVSNDFEIPVFQQHPEIKTIIDQLYAQGALYASMSGSGSAVYGIFEKGKQARVELPIQLESFCI